MNSKEKKEERYIKIRELQKGSFGLAYLVKKESNNEKVVIKTMILEGLSEQEMKEAFLEAKILKVLNHQNIIKFIEVFRQSRPKSSLNIVMEYAEGGDLFTRIRDQVEKKQYFEESMIIDWFVQICLAIKYIHKKKILHRDLKSKNIFLTKNGLIKLGDFGIAKCLSCTLDNARTVVGTPYYVSPEIVRNEPYSFKSDIWSLGVILYEMAALRMPFDGKNLPDLTMKIIKAEYDPIPSMYSKDLSILIADMLSPLAFKRPSIDDILKHKILKKRIHAFLNEVEMSVDVINEVLSKDKRERKVKISADSNSEFKKKSGNISVTKNEESKVKADSSKKIQSLYERKEKEKDNSNHRLNSNNGSDKKIVKVVETEKEKEKEKDVNYFKDSKPKNVKTNTTIEIKSTKNVESTSPPVIIKQKSAPMNNFKKDSKESISSPKSFIKDNLGSGSGGFNLIYNSNNSRKSSEKKSPKQETLNYSSKEKNKKNQVRSLKDFIKAKQYLVSKSKNPKIAPPFIKDPEIKNMIKPTIMKDQNKPITIDPSSIAIVKKNSDKNVLRVEKKDSSTTPFLKAEYNSEDKKKEFKNNSQRSNDKQIDSQYGIGITNNSNFLILKKPEYQEGFQRPRADSQNDYNSNPSSDQRRTNLDEEHKIGKLKYLYFRI